MRAMVRRARIIQLCGARVLVVAWRRGWRSRPRFVRSLLDRCSREREVRKSAPPRGLHESIWPRGFRPARPPALPHVRSPNSKTPSVSLDERETTRNRPG